MIDSATPGGCTVERKSRSACLNERLLLSLGMNQTTREMKIAENNEVRKKNGCRPQYYYEGNVNRYIKNDWKSSCKKKKDPGVSWV